VQQIASEAEFLPRIVPTTDESAHEVLGAKATILLAARQFVRQRNVEPMSIVGKVVTIE
jgi:hypothetical protein